MLEVLESLPKGITQLSSDDVLWLLEAVKTLGITKLQATTLAGRLSREPGDISYMDMGVWGGAGVCGGKCHHQFHVN